jgi:hypothetical protein
MVIKKGVALGSGTHHEYDQVFHDNLHDWWIAEKTEIKS